MSLTGTTQETPTRRSRKEVKRNEARNNTPPLDNRHDHGIRLYYCCDCGSNHLDWECVRVDRRSFAGLVDLSGVGVYYCRRLVGGIQRPPDQ